MREVAITGLGVCVPAYQSPEDLFVALAAGETLISNDSKLATMGVPGVASCKMSEDDVATLDSIYPELEDDGICTSGKMAYHALLSSVAQSKYETTESSYRSGLFFGVNKSLISPEHLHSMWQRHDSEEGVLAANRLDFSNLHQKHRPDAIVSHMVRKLAIDGPIIACADACAAGSSTILSGFSRIASGELDIAFCGAADEGSLPITQLLFQKIGALNNSRFEDATKICRPFDRDRNGCVLADGAAFLVLEDAQKARARGAEILAYVRGGYRTSEAHKMTSTNPVGSLYAETMLNALKASGLNATDINFINAHGTATQINDLAEGRAIGKVFGSRVPVTSTKSATGHSLAGSGAIEAVLSVLCLKKQQLLPTLNYSQPDIDEVSLDIVTQARPASISHVLSNSFGFGGLNASIVLSGEKA